MYFASIYEHRRMKPVKILRGEGKRGKMMEEGESN
jgi:hypothetical protein